MSQQRLAEYESGKRPIANITLGNASAICDALHVSNPRKLLDPEGTEQKKKDH